MLRAKNALAADARTAGHEVEATLTRVAFGRHLGAREDAKRARHAPPRDGRTFKAFAWSGCCLDALSPPSTRRSRRSCSDRAA